MTNLEIQNAYMGSDLVDKIYLGSEVVWAASQPEPSAMPLTFEITSPGDIVWAYSGSYMSTAEKTIEYSKNGGEWVSITSNSGSSGPSIPVTTGDMVRFRGDNKWYGGTIRYNHFGNSTCGFKLKGNIMSLIDSTGFTTATTLEVGTSGNASTYTFLGLFRWCTGLTDASDLVLPATSITCDGAYRQLFQDCINLVTPPRVFPATYVKSKFYCNATFRNCPSLTTAPEIHLTDAELTTFCFANMFNGCTSLTTAPELLVTGFTGTPNSFYNGMFSGCSNLNYVKCLSPARTDNNFLADWLAGVSSTGTFVKDPNETWPSGASGIPEGWTVQNAVL